MSGRARWAPFPEPEAAVGAAQAFRSGQASRAAIAPAQVTKPAEGTPSVFSIKRGYVQGEEGRV